ncbi:ATP-binding cassette (ABC) transporter [Komagataella phaffii CBS 7435]|uniref:Plasma membrane ATP-binding cassette (ABC) transporter, multidrug transporter involved in multidrug n=2 Tax=Komagataella phaffii TaxID=460519 RepID=C4R070_KOMPG|nr:Plasma membrane ATP-binding cassette (ABC) transporter, multidrug transporter involved in multidrug [Komagataella phaffii GS115]AOA62653.1 GQ67_00312T0 [Komagataella phaffii]CAH2448603.1 ATP-binding cassette (ABC) transporter [Komagataella phaffii CBS 7435]AOA67705.1 GQ68_01077T0 [Komagataella phaffii GS115]CAY68894.1 Plasma membrane ATP-binding cassette (ABC) transporter, multidrug transporter involved in multidrug [Komagataella phaffii GS115]CCA38704.1 ATP-binding cassette (ABC) transport
MERDTHEADPAQPVLSHNNSSGDEVLSYRAEDEQAQLEGVNLDRLQSLTKQMSHVTASEMATMVDLNDFDLTRILAVFAEKAEQRGLPIKSTAVELKDVSVLGVNDSASLLPTVSDLLYLPSTIARKIRNRKPALRHILKGVDFHTVPGEMCLVLGRPGAGCSSLLKTIAGETSHFVRVEGDIAYNNIPQAEMVKRFKNELIYNPELDLHFPHLTVEETLSFALACKTPRIRIDDISRKKHVDNWLKILLTVYGLGHTRNTIVGNDFVRGVSGGERKRVSIAEAMAANGTVYCWDNATRGLDASTALEFTESVRATTNLEQTTSFVTLYQPSERIYELFDKVLVLYEGRQIYFGPADAAKQFFVDMGYDCPPRQTTGEFLTAVTDPLQRYPRPGFENRVPINADEFQEYWRASSTYSDLQNQFQETLKAGLSETTKETFLKAAANEKMKGVSDNSKYTVNYFEQLRLCIVRGFQRIKGDINYTIVMVVSALIQGLVVGSLYWNTPENSSGVFGRAGVIFFAILFFVLMSLAEIANIFKDRPVLAKQIGYSLYHPSTEVIANALIQIPVKFIASLFFSIVVYFLANMKRQPGPFFAFLLFVNLGSQTMAALFNLVAAVSPTLAVANAFDGLLVLSSVLYTSYMIQRPSMVPWFEWFSYMNPMLYAFESMLTNEFHGSIIDCSDVDLIPNGPGYEDYPDQYRSCAITGANGRTYVDGDTYLDLSFEYSYSHIWRNMGILFLFYVAFLVIHSVMSEIMNMSTSTADRLIFLKANDLPVEVAAALNGSASSNDEETGQDTSLNEKYELERDKSEVKVSDKLLGSDEVFTWKDVNYVIPYQGSERTLLDHVQGYVKPGTLTALMGESGAGKTTLLNVLSQRIDVGVVTGDMLVNGNPVSASFKRRTGYVQQQDLHISELTVRESLIFAAKLRRPLSVPVAEKIQYVDQVIEILQMTKYKDAVAGELGAGLNVEQRKKLSIATELVSKPDLLLFLDEPTSGLDSQSSWAIVKLLRQLADAGQAILCTIHQPSATLFEQFDRLLLLRKGGQTVYFGDIGENSSVITGYFERNGARKCSPAENPAEYILEVIGAGATASITENWFDVWIKSPESQEVSQEISTLVTRAGNSTSSVDDAAHLGTFATPWHYQYQLVLQRTAQQFFRDMEYFMAKFMLLLSGGLLIGFSFWDVKHTIVGMQNAMFAVFSAMILSAPLSNQIQSKAIASRELYEARESKSNTFHWSALLLSQFLVEIPYSVVFSTIFYICWYFPVQLDNAPERAGVWWLHYCIFFQLYYISFALATVYFAPDLPTANVILSFLFNFIFAFCGVVQPVDMMPGFWTFMNKVSPYTYFVQSFLGNVLHGREVHCAANEMTYIQPPSEQSCGEYLTPFIEEHTGYVANPGAFEDCGFCKFAVGDQYLSTVGIKYSYGWRNVGFYWVYIVFNLSAMLFLYYMFKVRKQSIFAPIIGLFGRKQKD